MRTVMLMTFAVAAAVIFLIIVLIARQIIAPIKGLTKTANLIAEGNLDVTAEENSDTSGEMPAQAATLSQEAGKFKLAAEAVSLSYVMTNQKELDAAEFARALTRG